MKSHKLKYDFDDFLFIISGKASVVSSLKYAPDALVEKVRTDGILDFILRVVEIGVLFREEDN